MSAILLPGDPIQQDFSSIPGIGVHVHASQACASRSGALLQSRPTKASASLTSIAGRRSSAILPEVNNTVLARITRLTPRVANCSILAIYPTFSHTAIAQTSVALPAPPSDISPVAIPAQSQFSGQIRAQDVRATEKDKVVADDAFRVGDIVRAVVISLGDQRDYYLSTAGNEYGVLLAWASNEHGQPGGDLLEPVSWQEMRNTITGQKEKRKVAKPI